MSLYGNKQQPAGYQFKTANYDLVQTITLIFGTLYFSDNNSFQNPIKLNAGMTVVLPKGSVFNLWCSKRGYKGVYTFDPRSRICGEAKVLAVNEDIKQISRIINREALKPAIRQTEIINGLGSALLSLCLRYAGLCEPEDENSAYWAQRSMQILDAGLYSGRPASELLQGCGLGYRQLSRHFRECYGKTPAQYLLSARIDESKKLLQDTSLSITDIAYEMGFSSSQHFSASFKKATGSTPGQFLKKST